MKEVKRSEAIGMAIKMEEEGIQFYTQCADTLRHPLGKKMFASLVEDERRHAKIFQELAMQEGVVPEAIEEMEHEGPSARMNSVFREAGKHLKENLSPDDDDLKAIEMAKKMEEESFAFYTETARKIADPEEKRILLKIAAEENEHYRILDDTKMYLTYPEMWFIKEEKPVIDGG